MTPFQTNRDGKNRTEKKYLGHWFIPVKDGLRMVRMVIRKKRRGRPRKNCKNKPTV